MARDVGKSLVVGVVLWVAAVWPSAVQAQQVHRNGFEAGRPGWVKSGGDAGFEESAHAVVEEGAHDGRRCEFLKLDAKQGNFIHYQYAVGRASVNVEFAASLWLKANRPGLQLLARVVLPNERDANNLDERLTTFIRGDLFRTVGRWQRLELGRPTNLLKEQQQLMQLQLKRQLNFSDAYVDALLVNVYAGPGSTEVWIDDVEIGPVLPAIGGRPSAIGQQPTAAGRGPSGDRRLPAARSQLVEFNGSQLLVGGKRFFIRGIRLSDTPLQVLRTAGCNTVWLDAATPPALVQEAAELGFWMVPSLEGHEGQGSKAVGSPSPQRKPGPAFSQAVGSGSSADTLNHEVSRFVDNDAVLFWDLGGALTYEQTASVFKTAQRLRTADPARLLGADVGDGLMPYSRHLHLLSVHRWPLMTSLELPQYHAWLEQRRRLAAPGTFFWTWIQTHLPESYSQLLYERPSAQGFAEPVGPQPEHIRLLSYTALAAGCRGLGFWSDRFLADSHQGRDRLLCVALLNQELEMLEPLLLTLDDPPEWVPTSVPEVKAAVLRSRHGVLVLPIWVGKGAQFVPGQAAVSKLTLVVPQVPASTQAWEVTPGEVRGLRLERVVGGTKVTVPEFGLTTALVFTADTSLVVRFQEQAKARRRLAAQWTYEMARYELDKVVKIEQQLERQGHTLPDGPQLLADAQARLQTTQQYWDSHLFGEAYREGQRALRPLRILMRGQWEQAIKGLDAPVASPYAVSFFSLPRHWQLLDQIQGSVPTGNVLAGGDFENVLQRAQDNWTVEEPPTLDDVELLAQRVGEIAQPLGLQRTGGLPSTVDLPYQGKQCLMLQIKPKNRQARPAALERTRLALTSPAVRLQPGTLVRISGWVRIPQPITASPDGALFYDSAGGEGLAIRLTEPCGWKKFTLYRRVPASGAISVTLALTGIGTAYFDDVRIEPLVPGSPNNTVQAGYQPEPGR